MYRKTWGATPRAAALAGSGVMLAAILAACGGSANAGQTPDPAASQPTSGAAAESAIKADWVAFFNGKTPHARRVLLLQNGKAFAAMLEQQAKLPMAESASAKVTKVMLVSYTRATVMYAVLIQGKTVLPHQTGTAVYEDGTWKVGVSSFCGLLAMENGGKTSQLPAACRSTS